MVIRWKLALWFAGIVSTILIVFSSLIYLSSAKSRQNDFYNRLHERALITASLATDITDADRNLLRKIDTTAVSLEQEQVMIFDRNGKMAYNNKAVNRNVTSKVVQDVFRHKTVRLQLADRYEGVGVEYGNRDYSYAVVISAIDKHGYKRMHNLQISLIIGTVLGIIISLLAGLFFATRALKPMSTVVGRVNNISEKNLHERLDIGNGRDEISELSSTFNRMLARLEEAFAMQKAFVSHASHDFRTPLTVMLGEIEVMLLQHPNTPELTRMLLSLKEEIITLNALSSKLLDLAKASVDASNASTAKVRIDEVLFTAIAECSRAYPSYRIQLDFSELPCEESLLTVDGDEQLLKTAFVNLISNGCKFSTDGSIHISIKCSSSRIEVAFADRGIGIPTSELDKIFQPFYRVQSDRKIPGHGLGLALTSRVISLHGGHIDVQSEVGKGSTFTVVLGKDHLP